MKRAQGLLAVPYCGAFFLLCPDARFNWSGVDVRLECSGFHSRGALVRDASVGLWPIVRLSVRAA